MTHDSIGLGEDGPTHQPVEHIAMLRATPNIVCNPPADAVETAEAWEVALGRSGPTTLALTRQNVPTVREKHVTKNQVAQGAYVLADADGRRRVILIATGSEVEIALAARAALQKKGIGTRVVSMPSMELFAEQDEAYRRRILPPGPVRIGIEAAVRQGWDRWLSSERGNWKKARLRWHGQFRRVGALQGSLRPFRDHHRGRRPNKRRLAGLESVPGRVSPPASSAERRFLHSRFAW